MELCVRLVQTGWGRKLQQLDLSRNKLGWLCTVDLLDATSGSWISPGQVWAWKVLECTAVAGMCAKASH